MKRKIALISLFLVVLILSTSLLCACGVDNFTSRLGRRGYVSKRVSINDLGDRDWFDRFGHPNYEWEIYFVRDKEYVTVTKYVDADLAIIIYREVKENLEDGCAVKRYGRIVIHGTKKGVKDAT